MKIKSEKAYTGVDIAISVVVIFIFVSLISFLIYKMNSDAKEVELKTKAIDIALEAIEGMKAENFAGIENLGLTGLEEYTGLNTLEVEDGFERTIYVEDYAYISGDPNVLSGLLKRVTVRVEYYYKKRDNQVELSTIISNQT